MACRVDSAGQSGVGVAAVRNHQPIALISSSYEPYSGGVEEHVRQVAAELRHRGWDVVVWTVDRGEHLGVQLVDRTTVRYLPTPLPSLSMSGVAAFLRAVPGAVRAWARAYKTDRPGLLHVQCFGPNGLYSLALSIIGRVPLVVSSHGETFADDHDIFGQSRLARAGLTAALRRALAVTCCSEVVARHLASEFGSDRAVVVPNGVRSRVAAPSGVTRSGRIVAVGRLERTKGFDLLIRAVARVRDRPVELVIVGEGSQRQTLVDLAAAEGISDITSFVGRLGRSETDHLLDTAAVIVVPSRREAFGIVVLEAWQAGKPLVATSHDGPGDLVHDGEDGLVVDPEDVDALAAAISRVLADPDGAARLAANGARRVRDFSWTSVVEQYEAIYRSDERTPEPQRVAAVVV